MARHVQIGAQLLGGAEARDCGRPRPARAGIHWAEAEGRRDAARGGPDPRYRHVDGDRRLSGHRARGDSAPGGRSRRGERHPLRSGLLLDHDQRRVWVDGTEVALTFQEFELLAFLSAHPSTVFTRSDLVTPGLAARFRGRQPDGRRARQPAQAQARPVLRPVPGHRVPRRLPVPPRHRLTPPWTERRWRPPATGSSRWPRPGGGPGGGCRGRCSWRSRPARRRASPGPTTSPRSASSASRRPGWPICPPRAICARRCSGWTSACR